MNDPMKDVAIFHVWVHSNADTGKPYDIDVFEICGKVHMQWFTEAMEPDTAPRSEELATQFYEHLGKTEDSAWFVCRMMYETACEPPEAYVEVLGVLPVSP